MEQFACELKGWSMAQCERVARLLALFIGTVDEHFSIMSGTFELPEMMPAEEVAAQLDDIEQLNRLYAAHCLKMTRLTHAEKRMIAEAAINLLITYWGWSPKKKEPFIELVRHCNGYHIVDEYIEKLRGTRSQQAARAIRVLL